MDEYRISRFQWLSNDELIDVDEGGYAFDDPTNEYLHHLEFTPQVEAAIKALFTEHGLTSIQRQWDAIQVGEEPEEGEHSFFDFQDDPAPIMQPIQAAMAPLIRNMLLDADNGLYIEQKGLYYVSQESLIERFGDLPGVCPHMCGYFWFAVFTESRPDDPEMDNEELFHCVPLVPSASMEVPDDETVDQLEVTSDMLLKFTFRENMSQVTEILDYDNDLTHPLYTQLVQCVGMMLLFAETSELVRYVRFEVSPGVYMKAGEITNHHERFAGMTMDELYYINQYIMEQRALRDAMLRVVMEEVTYKNEDGTSTGVRMLPHYLKQNMEKYINRLRDEHEHPWVEEIIEHQ